MLAQEVNLVVLGPRQWYEYKKGRTHPQQRKFKLGWLAKALGDGLDSFTDGIPRIRFSFKEFTDLGEPKLTAAGIVRDAFEW